MNSRKDSNYDIFFLQNRVAELNYDLSTLKGKIQFKINQLKGAIPWEEFNSQDVISILENLLKE